MHLRVKKMNIDIFTHAPPLGKNTRQVLIITHQAEEISLIPERIFFRKSTPAELGGGGRGDYENWIMSTKSKMITGTTVKWVMLPCRGKENLITEQNELKLQKKLVEEGRDNLKYQYKQCLQQINESKDGHEASLKECGELKRLLKDAEMEKQVAWSSANELRELVKMTESTVKFCAYNKLGNCFRHF